MTPSSDRQWLEAVATVLFARWPTDFRAAVVEELLADLRRELALPGCRLGRLTRWSLSALYSWRLAQVFALSIPRWRMKVAFNRSLKPVAAAHQAPRAATRALYVAGPAILLFLPRLLAGADNSFEILATTVGVLALGMALVGLGLLVERHAPTNRSANDGNGA